MGSIWDVMTSSMSSAFVIVFSFSVLIFVHELGHFLAAIYVGVRVERFFIGFDVWGLALKKEYKGVVYGIGLLPLGGYVKLAGQADDPREQKIAGKSDELPSKPLHHQALVYVAGVVMNLILGFILLVAAYTIGIEFSLPYLGRVQEGMPAYIAGLRPGDEVLAVNGKKIRAFSDIPTEIASGIPGQEILIKYRREKDGKFTEDVVRVLPQPDARREGLLSIGVQPSMDTKIALLQDEELRDLVKMLRQGDRVTHIENAAGEMIILDRKNAHELGDMVKNFPRKKIKIRVKRTKPNSAADDPTASEILDLVVPLYALPKYTSYAQMGIRIAMKISGIVKDSPAAKAGLAAGDSIHAIEENGKMVYFRGQTDLSDLVNANSFRPTPFLIQRGGKALIITVSPRGLPGNVKIPHGADTFLGILTAPAAGGTGFIVKTVIQDGPGAVAGLRENDIVLGVKTATATTSFDTTKPLGPQVERASSKPVTLLVLKDGKSTPVNLSITAKFNYKEGRPLLGFSHSPGKIVRLVPGSLADKHPKRNDILGAKFVYNPQKSTFSPDLTSTYLTLKKDGKMLDKITLATPPEVIANPIANGLEYHAVFGFTQWREARPAKSFAEACSLAGSKWADMSLMIYTTIVRLFQGYLKVKHMGSVIMIFRLIDSANAIGYGFLLYLVALISINLGICNLLPFPVLDGGHLTFLLIEWVKGSPPSDRVKEYSQYIGLVCLLGLLLTVTFYDVKRWLF